jgi:tetratricopeptide (TPR) repeat protein
MATKSTKTPKIPAKNITPVEAMRRAGGFARSPEVTSPAGLERTPSPLEQAQDLYFRACLAPSKAGQIRHAQRAIATSPLCADAYTLLGEHEEPGSDEQLELFMIAQNAGRQAIGRRYKEYGRHFWGFLETRPYMRAKLALALCLWKRDERSDSLAYLRELLELNPGDNQGVRSIAAAYLIEEGLFEEAAALLKRYKDDHGADMAFSRALLAFAQDGDCAGSRKKLASANARNPHVRQYLTGQTKFPKTLPGFYSLGSSGEAVIYVLHGMNGWRKTPGAIAWLSGGARNKPVARAGAASEP